MPIKDIFLGEAGSGVSKEISLGQWCLPMLLSPNPQQPLIDWDFHGLTIETRRVNQRLNTVSLPARFVGRRAELRRIQSNLFNGKLKKILITGPGGQGKTSLAGKLALDLQARGYTIFAWSARPENPWRGFELNMEMALDEAHAKKFDHFRLRFANDAERAECMISLLMEQCNRRVVFFFDNMKSLQDPGTLVVADPLIEAWVQTAAASEVILLVTSRWRLPEWKGEHLLLERVHYSDFLQMAQGLALAVN